MSTVEEFKEEVAANLAIIQRARFRLSLLENVAPNEKVQVELSDAVTLLRQAEVCIEIAKTNL